MRKTSKILLSALAVSSMFYMITVSAEEIPSTKTTSQETTTLQTQLNQLQTTGMGSGLFDAITKEKFDDIVPNTIDIAKTKTDFVNAIIENEHSDNNDIFEKQVEEINAEVQTKIITLFENSGYMDTEEIEKEVIKVEMQDPLFDFYSITVSFNIDGTTKYSKNITIEYAKEDNYSTADETYVKNKLNNIKFANYEGNDAVFTIYNLGDEESANKWTENTYDFNKLLDDDSIVIKTSMFAGGFGGGTPWGIPMLLHFYKNGVLYETKPIWNLGAYGTTLENGTPVNIAKLETDDETYKALAKELSNRGLSNIIGCYELEAYGTTTVNMKVSFNIESNYNGKEVQILHKKKDNTYEIFKTTVVDGKAEITVSEFSPFMIALTENTTVENVNQAPNNAQTSSINIVWCTGLAMISLIGIVYFVISKKKAY